MPQIGRTINIKWSSIDWVDPDLNPLTVKIELSRNGGSTWETLSASAPNTGSFSWTVTGPASSNCVLRFSDPDDASVNFTRAVSNITLFGEKKIYFPLRLEVSTRI